MSSFGKRLVRAAGGEGAHAKRGRFRKINNLTVVKKIEGATGFTHNRAIEATAIGKMSIGGMSSFAKIILS